MTRRFSWSAYSTARQISAGWEEIRRCWREHLELDDDEQLRAVVRGLRIIDGHRSLQELREQSQRQGERPWAFWHATLQNQTSGTTSWRGS